MRNIAHHSARASVERSRCNPAFAHGTDIARHIGALAVNLLWAHLAPRLAGPIIVLVESGLVDFVSNVRTTGNVLHFASGDGFRVLSTGCSAVSGASMALLLWQALARDVRPIPVWSEAAIGAGIVLSVVVINTVRIVMTMQSVADYHLIHDGEGASWFNAFVLFAGLAWTIFGLRRELQR